MRTFCVNPEDRLTWHQDGEECGSARELWAQQRNGRNSISVSHPELARTETIAATIYHSLCTGKDRTTGQITIVCGPGVQQKAGQINAYLTSSETVLNRTVPSQIIAFRGPGEQQNHTGEGRFALLWRGRSKIQQYVRKSSLPVDLERESDITLLLIERTTKLQQQNHSLSNSIHQESNRDITEENLSSQSAVSTENGKNAKCNHRPIFSVCWERDKTIGEWVADWTKSQTLSALVPNPVWVPPWFTSTSLSWKNFNWQTHNTTSSSSEVSGTGRRSITIRHKSFTRSSVR